MTEIIELVKHLENGKQADPDGVMVTVSRHAVTEAVRLLRLLGETEEALAACQSQAGGEINRLCRERDIGAIRERDAECDGDAVPSLPERDRRELLRLHDALAARLAEAERQLASFAQGAKISIPTDTMEQEFAAHYRRGYEAGKAAATADSASDGAKP